MNKKKTLWAVAAALIFLFLIFAWLFWGSTVPEPTDPGKTTAKDTVKAAVYNTILNREAPSTSTHAHLLPNDSSDSLITFKSFEPSLTLMTSPTLQR